MSNTYNSLIESVEIDNIFLRGVNCERFLSSGFKGDIQTEIAVAQRLEFKTSERFGASVNFKVNAFDEYDEQKGLFLIDCSFILEYRYNSELESSMSPEDLQEAIKLFVERNVPLNAWPYGREFISQMTTRMGLPQLVIGTYKYIPSQDGEED